ncbi:hypothetical protein ACWY4P_43745 [Streptomyces sp. LZ34]
MRIFGMGRRQKRSPQTENSISGGNIHGPAIQGNHINSVSGGNVYGSVTQANHIDNVNIIAQDPLWEKRHEAYEAFNSTWAQFNSYMRECERILAERPTSTKLRAAVDRHAKLIDEWQIQMGRITLIDSDITAAKEVLEAAVEATREMTNMLNFRVSILEGEHFTGRLLQERREKLESAKSAASKQFWQFLTHSSSMLGVPREPGADR